ncbi:Ribosome maturation factor RimM [Luteitalea pratensis]|uniref:Ribosome maturation factor RimM n=1 Tax=Luteitalea pratensis TaxID=1855912 RepID=A0A143PT34_LUTPR|nr:ribosome maturation factor RimM [Luteitalea pratensis]AMY10974.1 Ribosome maturation factor RimM [Luteitalea pratensis]
MERWEDMVLVGRIARPHGLRGDVLIAPETDFPEVRFAEGAALFARRDETLVALEIDRSRVHAGKLLVGFRGLERIEDVEGLGRELRIPESALVPLPEGEYYWYQYVGAPVQTEAGESVGTVVRVEPTGGSGMLVVQRGTDEVQIPLTPSMCPVLRPDLIVVRPPEGLLDLNTRGPKRRAHRHRDHLPRHGAGRPPGGDPGAGGGQRTD